MMGFFFLCCVEVANTTSTQHGCLCVVQHVMRVCLRPDGGGVHLPGDLQAVEALHVCNGLGQHLGGVHGGHLPAGLRQVAELT